MCIIKAIQRGKGIKMALPVHYTALTEIKRKKDEFEEDGRHCMGINLTPALAKEVLKELCSYYGKTMDENHMTLFGAEVLSTDSEELSFEE